MNLKRRARRSFFMRLRAARKGVAMVEFAFVAPLLMLMILGGLELANYALAHMRVSQIAMSVADNSGRVNTGIDEANIYEVFAGAEILGEPLDFEPNGRVILSSLQENKQNGSDKGQMIHWQRCWGNLAVDSAYGKEGKGKNDNSLQNGMGKSNNRIKSAPGTAVMFVEVSYDYQPLVAGEWVKVDRISYESAFNVRGRQNQNISNGQSLTVLDCGT